MSGSTRTTLEKLFTSLSESGFTDRFLDSLSPSIIWTATGTSPVSGRYESKKEYTEKVLQPLHARLATTPQILLERMLIDGEWATVIFRSKGAMGHNGTDFSMQYCWIMKVVGGVITEVIGFYDQKKMWDLFR